jgi:hypothetical protein
MPVKHYPVQSGKGVPEKHFLCACKMYAEYQFVPLFCATWQGLAEKTFLGLSAGETEPSKHRRMLSGERLCAL